MRGLRHCSVIPSRAKVNDFEPTRILHGQNDPLATTVKDLRCPSIQFVTLQGKGRRGEGPEHGAWRREGSVLVRLIAANGFCNADLELIFYSTLWLGTHGKLGLAV